MLRIAQMSGAEDLKDAIGLVRELTTWAMSLDPDAEEAPAFNNLENELAELPVKFAPPGGCFLLARESGRPVGCVSYCAQGEPGVVELKRMYVRPGQRGSGLGVALLEAVIERARAEGVRRIVLDSYHTMTSAHKIYRAAGFRDVGPPPGFPEKFVPVVVFMEMDL